MILKKDHVLTELLALVYARLYIYVQVRLFIFYQLLLSDAKGAETLWLTDESEQGGAWGWGDSLTTDHCSYSTSWVVFSAMRSRCMLVISQCQWNAVVLPVGVKWESWKICKFCTFSDGWMIEQYRSHSFFIGPFYTAAHWWLPLEKGCIW